MRKLRKYKRAYVVPFHSPAIVWRCNVGRIFFPQDVRSKYFLYFFRLFRRSFFHQDKKKKRTNYECLCKWLLLAPRPRWWAWVPLSHYVRQRQNERFFLHFFHCSVSVPFSLVFSGPSGMVMDRPFFDGHIPYAFILWFNTIWLLCDAFHSLHRRVISSFPADKERGASMCMIFWISIGWIC